MFICHKTQSRDNREEHRSRRQRHDQEVMLDLFMPSQKRPPSPHSMKHRADILEIPAQHKDVGTLLVLVFCAGPSGLVVVLMLPSCNMGWTVTCT